MPMIMEAQITRVAELAFFHLHQAKLLAPYLAPEHLATVIHATVTSRLDYCNSLYAGLLLALTRNCSWYRMQLLGSL